MMISVQFAGHIWAKVSLTQGAQKRHNKTNDISSSSCYDKHLRQSCGFKLQFIE